MIVLSACMPGRYINGWVPYWNATAGRAGFTNPATAPTEKGAVGLIFTLHISSIARLI